MKKLYVLMDLSTNSYKFHENNINYFKKELGELNIIDVSKIIKRKSEDGYDILSNYKLIVPDNLNQLKKIINNEEIILMYTLNDNFKYFFVNYCIAKSNSKKIIISNLGYNPENFNYFKKNLVQKFKIFFKLKFKNYLVRIFVLMKIHPKIDYFFESSGFIIKSILNGKSMKLRNKIPWLNLSYYQNVIKINSRHYDNLFYSKYSISEKYIVFIDGMLFDHRDRIIREGIPLKDKRDKYYNNLYDILTKLGQYYDKEVIICLHPKNNISHLNNDFKNLFCVKYETEKYISNAHIVLFHESSSIIQAIVQKKKIINLNGSILGDYLKKRCELYTNLLNLHVINIDENKVDDKHGLKVKLDKSIKNYNEYIENNIINDPLKSGILQVIDHLKLR